MGAACNGLCVPIDLSKAVQPTTWSERGELCSGCKTLATPWAVQPSEKRDAVGASVFATGSDPDYSVLILNEPLHTLAAYDASGRPVAAFRTDYSQQSPCGRLLGLKFDAGRFGAYFLRRVGEPHQLVVGDPKRLGELMRSREVSFTFAKSDVGQSGINDFWFSSSEAAIDLSGNLLVQNRNATASLRPQTLPGAGPGEYTHAQVSGSSVFVTRWHGFESSVLVLAAAKLEPLLGETGQDIQEFVTDGEVMVWKQGRDPISAPPGSTPPLTFEHYDLMLAPFTTSRTELRPRVLLKDAPASLGWLRLANGFLSGIYLTTTTNPIRSGALVAELASGRVLRSELPGGYSYGYGLFTSATELWGAITPDPLQHFETYARVPYAALETLQTTFPK
jgi:hypothetical protein